jgi:NitT/TauT family transport system ATP-binding protein
LNESIITAFFGGMQKRVALIQTLAFNPDIPLLNGVFGSLDAQTRLLVEDEFIRISRETKKTVIMVTHDISEAILMAGWVLELSARPGRAKADHKIYFEKG